MKKMDNTKPRFLLCPGAQKCGTTWLYDYLIGHSQVDMGFTKEYHVFDTLFCPNDQIIKDHIITRINRAISANHKVIKFQNQKLLEFVDNTDNYYRYFSGLMSLGNNKILTGDITPTYIGLKSDHYTEIRTDLNRFGFEPKIVFLMRDPVERCVSAVRMQLKEWGPTPTWDAELENQWISARYNTDFFTLRGSYHKVLTELYGSFDKSQICLIFYEELFSVETIQRLCNFLEISYEAANFNRRLNVSSTEHKPDPALLSCVFEHNRQVYEFMVDLLGYERMLSVWPRTADL